MKSTKGNGDQNHEPKQKIKYIKPRINCEDETSWLKHDIVMLKLYLPPSGLKMMLEGLRQMACRI
jgi:hypothetical protein